MRVPWGSIAAVSWAQRRGDGDTPECRAQGQGGDGAGTG